MRLSGGMKIKPNIGRNFEIAIKYENIPPMFGHINVF